ncbi:50S ribosomal protein L33 [Aerococcus sanguinicola]|uniref:Large ribosomal subunit protein bL33 n=1 Tax=Aerococcus sanguinicola TaxID=119206 RepID=A0A2I1MQ82_9LACT|nr:MULTISPECIES: 50S ribosomal protein L33 [Aerococcus]KAB0646654.1 50S ribosomal protein L33 [Aerococcus sanguinicola]MDK6233922.1 50S ribosomal protein L33 [Aerococcus sp. UMB10185]MDK6805739.1 50S ribosomal protein L33 [Aerococcus sp. UMB7834]MDK6856361.1 50S ribosomal protein L33 [Aerococcus sp. UMB7533]MDK7050203.1 50S ribosomal protein L33 [Aerococcus sanguinicola]
MATKKIILACSKCGSRNYTVKSNPANRTERLEVKKFCRHCKGHTLHQQTK